MSTPKHENDQVEKMQREMKRLLRLLSHDLRNPLVNMQALIQEISLLSKKARRNKSSDALDKELAENIGMLAQSVDQMREMIHGVNQLSQAMFDDVECEEIDLRELLERVRNRIEPGSGTHISFGHLPSVWADPLAALQLFESLLGYAVEVIGEAEGTIHVEAGEHADGALVTVTCKGADIDKGKVVRLFESINDVSADGIGLTLAKALTLAHGGTISCEALTDNGFYFSVILPKRIA